MEVSSKKRRVVPVMASSFPSEYTADDVIIGNRRWRRWSDGAAARLGSPVGAISIYHRPNESSTWTRKYVVALDIALHQERGLTELGLYNGSMRGLQIGEAIDTYYGELCGTASARTWAEARTKVLEPYGGALSPLTYIRHAHVHLHVPSARSPTAHLHPTCGTSLVPSWCAGRAPSAYTILLRDNDPDSWRLLDARDPHASPLRYVNSCRNLQSCPTMDIDPRGQARAITDIPPLRFALCRESLLLWDYDLLP